MNPHLVALLLLSICFPAFVKAQENFDTKEPRWKQLTMTYGFVMGQQASLEKVELNFPSLAPDLNRTRFMFNTSALGKGFKGVEDEFALKPTGAT